MPQKPQDKKSKKHSSESELGGYVYSTGSLSALQQALADAGFRAEDESPTESATSSSTAKATLEVRLERKSRAGKAAVLISGHPGTDVEIAELAQWLKVQMGSGGSVNDGVILIQGDRRDKIMELLQNRGFRCKRVGG
ncbi:translation initiation factor [bacterium]|nr:translation initiation factor [bacterium]